MPLFDQGLSGLYVSGTEVFVMSIAILGKKIGMTQIFDGDGNRVPVTVLEAGPCPVLKVKTAEGRDGYDAVVLGFGKGRKKSMTKPELGVFAKLNIEPTALVREIRVNQDEALLYPEGGSVDASLFNAGELVDVIGTSRGRGYQGVMKRHNFAGTGRSHGTHESFRHGGSIGMATYPGRVIPGTKMAGQMGNVRKTILNQRVVAVFPDHNLIFIEGGVPGAMNSVVVIRKATKVPKKRQG